MTLATSAAHKMLGGLADLDTHMNFALLPAFDASGSSRLLHDDFPLMHALRGRSVMDRIIQLRRSDEEVAYLRCNAAPLRHEGGPIRGALMLMQDVSPEWVATSKQAELRERLLTTVNHELRTPLTKILGHSEILMEALEDDELPRELSPSVAAIARASSELAMMANKLTHLGNLEAVSRVRLTQMDLAQVLGSAIESRVDVARSKNVQIHLRGRGDLRVTADRKSVLRAAQELVSNAVVHTQPGSEVRVEFQALDGFVEITVTDRGRGIARVDRERFVKPFERGVSPDGSTSTLGLGLALVSAVAAAHGGTLSLSNADHGGLVARLVLRQPDRWPHRMYG